MESFPTLLRVDVASPPYTAATLVALAAAVSDVRWFKIPNMLTFPLIALGVCFHGLASSGAGWLFAAAGLAFGLGILLPFFLLGGVGAGDVKLLAGIGACVGLHDAVAVFLVFGSLAGAYSTAMLFAGGGREGTPWRSMVKAFSSAQRVEDVLEEAPAIHRRKIIPLAPWMATALLVLAAAAVCPWRASASTP